VGLIKINQGIKKKELSSACMNEGQLVCTN